MYILLDIFLIAMISLSILIEHGNPTKVASAQLQNTDLVGF
jgi:hypothetical protein